MKTYFCLLLLAAVINFGYSYSKYGRKCSDIGCTSHEVCVMEEKPCTRGQRTTDCGQYPTCKIVNRGASTCADYVCPPTQVCRIDNSVPKCFNEATGDTKTKRQTSMYPGTSRSNSGDLSPTAPLDPNSNYFNYPQSQNPGYQQNYPQQPYNNPSSNSGLYPHLPSAGTAHGQNTPRPNTYQSYTNSPQNGYYNQVTTPRSSVYQPYGGNSGGYQGGSNGGYQGSNTGYGYQGNSMYTTPRTGYGRQPSYTTSNYGRGGAYPTQGYSSGGYPSQGYGNTGQGSGYYPNYPQYPQNSGYPSQGNTGYRQNTYNQRSGYYATTESSTIWNKIQKWGQSALKTALRL